MKRSSKKDKLARLNRNNKRAVIYIRYSSPAQSGGFSIEYQVEQAQSYIERKGYELVNTYIDEAKTAKKTAGRESLFRMMDDAKEDLFDVIVVFSFNRAFRNTRDALNVHFELYEKYGITTESIIEHSIDMTSSHGKFSATNLFAMHELSSNITAEHVKASMYYMVQQGYYPGGIVHFGYKTVGTGEFAKNKEKKKWAVCEKGSAIVREIYDLYLSGINSAGIRTLLLERGIDLSKKRILKILHNRFYIGEATYHFDGYEPLHIVGKHEPIIDVDTFNKVQSKFERYDKRAPRRRLKYSYALTGKIYCGRCGGRMISNTSKDYNYYFCSNRRKYNSCNAKGIQQPDVEAEIVKQITLNILNDNSIKQIVDKISELVESSIQDAVDIKQMNKKREQIETSIKNTIKRENEGKIKQEMADELLDGYNAELEAIEKKITSSVLFADGNSSPEQIETYLRSFLNGDTGLGTYERVLLFDTFVERVAVFDNEKLHIQLKYAPNLFKVTNGRANAPLYKNYIIIDI